MDYSVPFELSISIPPANFKSSWTMRLFAGSLAAKDTEGADEMVDLFFMAAGHQLLGSSLEIQSESEVDYVARKFDSAQRVRDYSITSGNVPDTAWPVLIALLSQACKVGEPIRRVELNAAAQVSSESLETWAKSWQEVQIPPPLPFEVDWDSPGEDRPGLMVEWEFAARLPEEVAEYLQQVLYLWSQIVAFKGYCFEFCNQEVMFPSEGQSSHLAPTLFRYQWRDYAGPIHSLHSLFRWTLWLHQQGCRVEKMSLS